MLDVYAHVLPRRYFDRVDAILGAGHGSQRIAGYHGWFREFPALYDLEARWRLIDGLDDYRQILVPAVPPVEELGSPQLSAELARLANDEMAELVTAYDRFAGFVACLPFNDVQLSLVELERAVRELGALGMLAYTNVSGVAIGDPRYEPLFAEAARLGRAVWLHPTRGSTRSDYESEPASRFALWWSLGWPLETSLAMARLVYSGLFARHPELPVITHHGGGMVPQFADRLVPLAADEVERVSPGLSESIEQHLRLYYADTVLASAAALGASIDFFGVDRIMFGTDMPFGPPTMVQDVVATVKALGLSSSYEAQVFSENARQLLIMQ
jgi:predicted TIM-barrel fold metal-dependent hydrolase